MGIWCDSRGVSRRGDGESPATAGLCGGSSAFVEKAVKTAEGYERSEAGVGTKLEGSKSIPNSEASSIPALMIGELVDPNGTGAALNNQFQKPPDEMLHTLPQENPLYGKTLAEVKEVFADQIIWERLKIHMIFVAHPTHAEKEPAVLGVVQDLVHRAAEEQGHDYCDVRVGLLHNVIAVFTQAHAEDEATCSNIQHHLYEALALTADSEATTAAAGVAAVDRKSVV